MNEIKTITAELAGVKQQKSPKPHQYEFVNPEGSNYPLTVGAFPPNLPQLEIGKTYTFPCEYKPTKDDPHKFHKNFVRLSRDGPYDIKEFAAKGAKGDVCEPAPMGEPDPKLKEMFPSPRPAPTPQPQPTTRDDYWKAKEQRDIARQAKQDAEAPIREWAIRRGACQHDAAMLVASYINGGMKVSGKEPELNQMTNAVLQITDIFVEAAEKKEVAFRSKQAMGDLKPHQAQKAAPTAPAQDESVLANEGGEVQSTKKVKEP